MIALGNSPGAGSEYPVFIKRGDARGEIDEIAGRLGTDASTAGLHKTIYAARANQTVVLVTDRRSPLAAELRARGWEEPRDSIDPQEG